MKIPPISASKKGFTIVELLIVIVVIAILASIATVGYASMQKRSYASMAAAATHNYVAALRVYRSMNDSYPLTTSGADACLGDSSQYTAKDGFTAGQCARSNYTSYTASVDAGVVNSIKTQLSVMPSTNWPMATEVYSGGNTDYYRGILYRGYGTGNAAQAHLWYYLPGQSTCGGGASGGYTASTGSTSCSIHLD